MCSSGVDGIAGLESERAGIRQRVSYNALIRLSGRTLGALLTLVALRLATRFFGPSHWGLVVAASALANLFVGVCDFGLLRIVSREMAAGRRRDHSVYGGGLVAGALVSLVVMIAMTATILLVFVNHPAIRSLALVLVLSIPPNTFWVVSSAVFVAKARNDIRAVIDVASSLLLLGATGAVVAASFTVVGYIWLSVVADLLTASLSIGMARRYSRTQLRNARRSTLTLLRRAAPLGVSALLAGVTMQSGVVMLSLFSSSAAVGRFGVAFQVAMFGVSVPSMLTAAMLPKFVDAPILRQRRLFQRALDTMFLVASAIPLFALLFARGVILAVCGPQFIGATIPLELLACFAGITFVAVLFIDALVYIRAERQVLRTMAISTLANLSAGLVIIPLLGATGAAIAMIGSAVLLCGLAMVAFRRFGPVWISFNQSFRYVFVAALLAGSYELAHTFGKVATSTGLPMIPEVLAVALVYGTGILMVGGRQLVRGDPH